MCKVIVIGDKTTAIICGDPQDHVCDEKASVYEVRSGQRFYFRNDVEAQKWYNDNYKQALMGSVACSICEGALIDNAFKQ